MKKNTGLRSGTKVVMAFLAIEYFLPLSLNLAFDTQPLFRTPVDDPQVLFGLFIMLAASTGAVVLAQLMPVISPSSRTAVKPLSDIFLLTAGFGFLALGLYSKSGDLSQWRYSDVQLSQRSDLILISISQLILPVFLAWIAFLDQRILRSRKPVAKLIRALLLGALLLSINGLGGAIKAAVFGLVLLLPRQILPLLSFQNEAGKSLFGRVKNLGIVAILFLVLLYPMVSLGIVAKSGPDADIGEAASGMTDASYLINRHSVHMASAAAALQDVPELSNLNIVAGAYIYRLKALIGTAHPTDRPEIATYARKALLQFANFDVTRERMGSSPGLLGAAAMTFSLPWATLFVAVFLFALTKTIDFIFYGLSSVTWAGALVIAYMPLRLVTDSPFDMFLPGPVLVVLIVILVAINRRASGKAIAGTTVAKDAARPSNPVVQ